MANLKKVRITERVGDPSSGVIIQPGAVIDLPAAWADRYIAQGKAAAVEPKPVTDNQKPETEKSKGKKKKS